MADSKTMRMVSDLAANLAAASWSCAGSADCTPAEVAAAVRSARRWTAIRRLAEMEAADVGGETAAAARRDMGL